MQTLSEWQSTLKRYWRPLLVLLGGLILTTCASGVVKINAKATP